jgi:Cu(I)/Ag(I) efflux system membrane protein CusA/SilA
VFAGAVALLPSIGRDFMPPLNEGDLMFMPVTDPAIALSQAIEITQKQNAAIQQFPKSPLWSPKSGGPIRPRTPHL